MCVGHGNIMIQKILAAATLNFEKERLAWLALGVNARLREMRRLSSHTRALTHLSSPSRGWHGMAWFGRACLCLVIYFSFWRPFTPNAEQRVWGIGTHRARTVHLFYLDDLPDAIVLLRCCPLR